MNARFRGGFIAVLQRIPGFQKFCGSRFRGTNINASRYPNGESICLALNHQTYINKINKKSDPRIVKNDDFFNDEEGINGTDYEPLSDNKFCFFKLILLELDASL